MQQQQAQQQGRPAPALHDNFHILTCWDPQKNRWSAWELMNGSPLARVRQALNGRWTSSDGDLVEDMAGSFTNASNGRKVFVLRMPQGLNREACVRIMRAQ